MDDPNAIRPRLEDDEDAFEDDGCDDLYAGGEPPMPTLEELRESLLRADAQVAAGLTVDGEVVLAELRQMIEDYEAERAANGATRG